MVMVAPVKGIHTGKPVLTMLQVWDGEKNTIALGLSVPYFPPQLAPPAS